MNNIFSTFLITFLSFFIALPSQASHIPENLKLIDTGIVKEIIKPNLVLLDNKKQYKLDNIRTASNQSQRALTILTTLLLDKKVNIYTHHEKDHSLDRYGDSLAHIIRDDGIWIQKELILKGISWAFSSKTNRKTVNALKIFENTAREQKQGLWADSQHQIKTIDTIKKYMNSFQIVEGLPMEANFKGKTIYINFSKNWKEDFTIELSKKDFNNFNKKDINFNPEHWIGKNIRIRGWVQKKNGPMIKLTHPEQLDILTKEDIK